MPMDFANEQYVRVYRSDTVTIKLLSWQARALLWELLRKADRAGVVDVGENAERGIAALVCIPTETVRPALAELMATGTLKGGNGFYVFPRFLEAQEIASSDKQRQKESRARRRETAIQGTNSELPEDIEKHQTTSRCVTISDQESQNVIAPSQNVTECHTASHGVTLSSAVLCYATCPDSAGTELFPDLENPPPPEPLPKSRSAKKSKPASNPEHEPTRLAWFSAFQGAQGGAKPTWLAEHGGMLARLLSQHGGDEIRRRIANAFEAPPRFPGRPNTFADFVRSIDAFAVRHSAQSQASPQNQKIQDSAAYRRTVDEPYVAPKDDPLMDRIRAMGGENVVDPRN